MVDLAIAKLEDIFNELVSRARGGECTLVIGLTEGIKGSKLLVASAGVEYSKQLMLSQLVNKVAQQRLDDWVNKNKDDNYLNIDTDGG